MRGREKTREKMLQNIKPIYNVVAKQSKRNQKQKNKKKKQKERKEKHKMLLQIKLFNNLVVTKTTRTTNKNKTTMFILNWFYTTTTVNTNKHDRACKKGFSHFFKQNCK